MSLPLAESHNNTDRLGHRPCVRAGARPSCLTFLPLPLYLEIITHQMNTRGSCHKSGPLGMHINSPSPRLTSVTTDGLGYFLGCWIFSLARCYQCRETDMSAASHIHHLAEFQASLLRKTSSKWCWSKNVTPRESYLSAPHPSLMLCF